MAMSQDTFNRVKKVMDEYGVPPEIWYPIAMAESAGDPNAHGDVNLGGTGSWGLFQLYTGGGQGTGYSPEQLKNIELNATITAKHLAPAYNAIKGKYPDNLMASEVAIRSGHPAGSVGAPYRGSVALYNAIKRYAEQGIPEALRGKEYSGGLPGGGLGTGAGKLGIGANGDDDDQPRESIWDIILKGIKAGIPGGEILDKLQAARVEENPANAIVLFFARMSDILAYFSVNAALIAVRFLLVLLAVPIILLGFYYLLRSLGE